MMRTCGSLLPLLLFAAAACGREAGAVASYPVRVEGMICSACEETVEKAVARVDGVEKVEASRDEGIVRVSYDPTEVSARQVEEQVARAVEGAGYEIRPPRE